MVSLKYVHSKTPSFNSTPSHTLFFSLSINTWPIPLFFFYIYIHLNYGSKTPQLYIYPILFSEIYIWWVGNSRWRSRARAVHRLRRRRHGRPCMGWHEICTCSPSPTWVSPSYPPRKNRLQVKTRIMNLLNSFSFLCIYTNTDSFMYMICFFSFHLENDDVTMSQKNL